MLRTRKLIAAVLIILTISLTACSATTNKVSITNTVTKDEKFGSATINITPDEMTEAGFELADSCDVTFSSGYSLIDVPFYNGFYVKTGEPVIVAYPGNENIIITNNNVGIWDEAKLQDSDTITITLNTKQKYKDIQETLGQIYSVKRDDYNSDEEFCNFRALTGGNIKEDFLFRGTSPVDNSRGRASYTDSLLKEHGIRYVIDLADSQEDIDTYKAAKDFKSDYANGLLTQSKVSLLDLGSSYQSDEYKQSVANGLNEMLKNNEGPVYIHCMEGKDRTGFVCMLVEALAGASYEEMLSDYMITYKNYYSVTKEDTPTKYDAIAKLYFDSFIETLNDYAENNDSEKTNYVTEATGYLKSGGMTDKEIEKLIKFIAK